MLRPSTYYTLPLPKDWGLEKLRSIFYPLMAYYNIFGKVLSDLARVTELVHSSPKFFLALSCLYPHLTVFSPLNYSVGSVSHYLPTHFKTCVFDSRTSSFEGMLEISEDSGKELAEIWDFLGWSHLQALSWKLSFLNVVARIFFQNNRSQRVTTNIQIFALCTLKSTLSGFECSELL